MTCIFPGCGAPRIQRRRLCAGHQTQRNRRQELRPIERLTFQQRVERRTCPDGECLIWTGLLNDHGYGVVSLEGEQMLAHRAVWQSNFGAIPEGMCVCHRCDTPRCVRIEHLFLGTHLDNMRDMDAKGRRVVRTGEAAGLAKLTEAVVSTIRERHAAGESQRSLARKYGVHNTTIMDIVHHRTWRAA